MNTIKYSHPFITILTPTYNRAAELKKCYESLCNQKEKNFKWLIIDDGSTDNTKENINRWMSNINDFDIKYVYKDNGGKHTALNIGFKMVDTELTFIVDSDDILTEDATLHIYEKYCIIKDNNKVAGIAFLRGYDKKRYIGDLFPINDGIMNDIDVRLKKNIKGDKAEVWKTNILRNYEFPVFSGEKFQGENYVWFQIAKEYDMFYCNKIIYITEYLEGGLTKSGKGMRIRNPFGGMENSKIYFCQKAPLKTKFKCGILFITYGFFAKLSISEIINKAGSAFIIPLIPLGKFLYLYWNNKFGKE